MICKCGEQHGMCNEKTVDMISEDEYLVKMRRRMVDQRLKKVSEAIGRKCCLW